MTKPVPEATELTAYKKGANILIRLDNLPGFGYRAHPTLTSRSATFSVACIDQGCALGCHDVAVLGRVEYGLGLGL